MRGDEIELFAEIRQRRMRIDSRDDAANAEELGRPAEKRFVIGIEPENLRGRTAGKGRENIRGRSLDPGCRAAASDQARGPVRVLR